MTLSSSDWNNLLSTAKDIGCNEEEVKAFLEFIVAPPRLICGGAVLAHCLSLMRHLSLFIKMEEEYATIISADKIAAWSWSIKMLTESDPSAFSEIEGFNSQVTFGKKPPLRNYLKNHPLYAFLCHSAPEQLKNRLLTCQALGILVDARLRKAEEMEDLDYSELRYKFLLDLRKLVERESGRALLPKLPQEPLPLEIYINEINSLPGNNEILQSILARLRVEHKNILPTKKRSIQRSGTEGVFVSNEDGHLVGEKDEETDSYRKSGLKSQRDAIVEQFRKDGGHRTEIETGLSLVTPKTNGAVEVDDGSTKRQRAHAVRGYRNRISMLNQLLPSQKPGLSVWETAKLITYLYPPAEEQNQYPLLSVDVRLALGLMLWASVELQDLPLQKFYTEKHYQDLSSSGREIVSGLMSWRDRLYAVILPATAPVHHTDPNQLKHLLLPLPDLVAKLWQNYKRKRGFPKQFLFSRGKDGIIPKVTEALNDIRKCELGDYTPSRISRHLFHLSLTIPAADITAPMFWSGKFHYLGRVVAHYTRYSVKQLCEHYEKNCFELMLQVGDDLARMGWGHSPKRLLTATSATIEQSGYVGSPFCPEVDRLKNIFFKLKEDINACLPAQKDRIFPAELYKLHNPYTLYTMLGIALASGARVIGKAIKVPATVHNDSGFAVINEKNSLDYFNSRLVWLPPAIQQQYRNYLAHLENIFLWLYIVDRERALSLKASLRSDNVKGKISHSWLFMLDEANNVIPADRTDIIKILGNYGFDFKGNALRHLLRTWAVKYKVPTEIINAQLGHWDNGQAPWEKWSFLSASKMKEKLSPVQEGLLAEVNFRALEGIGSIREVINDLDDLENIQTAEQISLF